MMPERVLVVGDDSRSALSVVRSLGRQGIEVAVAVQHGGSVVTRSRYVRRVFPLPSADVGDAYITALRTIVESERFDLVIPTADEGLVPLVRHRASIEPLVRCAIPDQRGFDYTYRKTRTVEMASALNVPIPRTRIVSSPGELESLAAQAGSLPWPLVIKPDSSKVWTAGRRVELSVTTVHDVETLRRRVGELLPLVPVMVQDRVPGVGVGQEFLADAGEVLLAFQHERVHEPMGGGGSSYRKSVPLDATLLAHSAAMLRHMRWTGVAMVEYKRDPETGHAALMEINGRFWGSLPLAIAAGADFPYELFTLLVRGERRASRPYRVGLHARNIERDVEWVLAHRGRGAATVLGEQVRVFQGCERWDSLTVDDPRPFLSELAGIASDLTQRLGMKWRTARLRMAYGWPASRAWLRAGVKRRVRRPGEILVLCKGNICRSPFAERSLRSALDARGLPVRVVSAGLYPESNRRSPAAACEAAAELGFPLDGHRSTTLSAELVRRADVILCMETAELLAVRREFPAAAGKVMLLGAFAPDAVIDIEDPWGKPVGEFTTCYRLIQASVNQLAVDL